MRVIVIDGVIYEITRRPATARPLRMINAPEADAIAQANGHQWAEQFTREHSSGKSMELDDSLKIRSAS